MALSWTEPARMRLLPAEEERGPAMKASSDADQLLLAGAGDPGSARCGEHVDFAADAELGLETGRQVDAGLDGEAGVGQDLALVVGFEVVEMSAGAVEFRG